MSSSNYYNILGVDPNASPQEIRKAYKKRALQTHPDRLPQGATQEDKTFAEEEFRKVNNAYEVLTDENKRKAYDIHGAWPPPEGVPNQTGKGAGSRDDFFTDPFNDPFFGSPFRDPFFRSPFGSTSGSPFVGENRRPHVFRDPFELFNSIFAEMERDFRGFDNFPHRTGFPNQGLLFPSLFSRVSPFSSPFSNMIDFSSEGGNMQSYSYSSSGVYRNDGNGGSRWVSESTQQKTINGVTHTIIEKKDSEGNIHVRKIYPDGRERYTINGVEQSSSSPPAIQGSSPAGALAPPPPVHNSRPEQIHARTHSSRRGKEREVRFEPRSTRVDRHSVSSSYSSSSDRTVAERERAERRSKKRSHGYDYEVAPPAREQDHPKKSWWGRG